MIQVIICHSHFSPSNLEEAKSRALDNLGRVYARMGEFQKAIDSWATKLPMSKSPLESTWLYHEIGRCNLELGSYKEAKDFGEKSSAAANEADDKMWQLNATVLIAQAEGNDYYFRASKLLYATSLFCQLSLGETY